MSEAKKNSTGTWSWSIQELWRDFKTLRTTKHELSASLELLRGRLLDCQQQIIGLEQRNMATVRSRRSDYLIGSNKT